jgi:hypothetical protein
MDPASGKKDRPEAQQNNCGLSATSGRALGGTPPGWFFAKSAETIENKGVEFLVSAKKCKNVQKSAQECEKKELEVGSG